MQKNKFFYKKEKYAKIPRYHNDALKWNEEYATIIKNSRKGGLLLNAQQDMVTSEEGRLLVILVICLIAVVVYIQRKTKR